MTLKIPQDYITIAHFDSDIPVIFENETYITVHNDAEDEGQMEYWTAIFQRQSDDKYFKCEWSYDTVNWDYEYNPEWIEVKQKIITKITYE